MSKRWRTPWGEARSVFRAPNLSASSSTKSMPRGGWLCVPTFNMYTIRAASPKMRAISSLGCGYRSTFDGEENGGLREPQFRRRKSESNRGALRTANARYGYFERVRDSDELRQRSSLHLPHYVRAMDLIRDLADAKMCGGLLVEKAADDQRENFALTGCQQRKSLL